jgi:transposase
MSLQSEAVHPVPAETARVAREAFPQGNAYMRMRDEFGALYTDDLFRTLFARRGQPAESPAELALVTVMQFAEGLSDRQAAEAVRARIDWKYALGLELTDSGFDASVLVEFRVRLVAGQAEALLLETLLQRVRAAGLLKARGRQRTDSTHVLAAIQTLNRLECVGETMRQALNALAVAAPEWLQGWVPPTWFERYERRFEEFRLPPGRPERYALAETIGADGFQLLQAISGARALPWLRTLRAVETLRRVWIQQFYGATEPVRWREADDLPPSTLLICSPYDPEARYSQKRSTTWTGYKVHFTETCDPGTPNLITDVQTTPAPVSDAGMTIPIQQSLAARDLLPAEHIVDAGYPSAEALVVSQQGQQVNLVGPVGADLSWQGRTATGFDVATFVLDWEQQRATCPQGHASVSWVAGHHAHAPAVVTIKFARNDCAACAVRAQCTHSASGPRALRLRAQPYHEALQAARQRQTTDAFQMTYAQRAGIEGTISQGVRRSDVRHARYIGLAKTHLQNLFTAVALNLLRVAAWLQDIPRARTRRSPFARLAPAGA